MKSRTEERAGIERPVENIHIDTAIVFILCAFFCLITPLYAAPPRLHVEGNKVKDPNGNIVVLRGVSMIDLGSQQQWYGGATALIDRITDLNDSNGDSPGWYTKVIRIPIFPPDGHTWPYEFNPNNLSDPNNETLYNLLRTVVDYCAEKNVYAVIDWHGIANTYDLNDQTVAFWQYMAPRFKDDSHVIFELFCEPINQVGSTDADHWASVKSDMETWIGIIRDSGAHNLLLVGTPSYCQIIGPTADNPVSDANVVYITHIYPLHWNSNNQYYRDSITAAAKAHPVILGEWGFTTDLTYDDTWHIVIGTQTNYGEPIKEFVEGIGVGSIAWCANYNWGPPMFNTDWTLRCGEGEMGCFTKDWLFQASGAEQDIALTIAKCNITAGKTQYVNNGDYNDMKDTLVASGTLASSPLALSSVTHIDVNIISADGNSIFFETNPFNSTTDIKKSKYTHKYKIPKGNPTEGAITSMVINFNKKTFAVTVTNADLTGLACPLRLSIKIGNYMLSGDADEAIVNGKKLIPTRLMRLYGDTLVVNKAKAKHSTKASSDSLSVKGDIAVAGMNLATGEPNLVTEDVVLTWGDQNGTPPKTLTIPGNDNPALGSFKASKKGHVYKCSKIHPAEDINSSIAAQFDLDKCVFTVSVSKADSVFVGSGPADSNDPNFSVSFDTPNGEFSQAVDVNRVTGRSY